MTFLSKGEVLSLEEIDRLCSVFVEKGEVPENMLKFAVAVILSAFGLFWTGEGLRISWPGEDLAILAFAVLFLPAGIAAAALARGSRAQALP
jgi:Ca2+/H+ antiporter, TMEM165/GDT1 family